MEAGPLMLIALLGAHCFFDYAGQGDFMAKAKNATAPIPGVPWFTVLLAHSALHGAAVGLITGIWYYGVGETFIHALTDDAKCRGWISFNQDQAIHVALKVVWWLGCVWVAA